MPAPHLTEPELTQVTDESFDAFMSAIARGFQEEDRVESRELDRRLFDNDRMFGFTVGDRWVATFGDFGRRLTVPGGAAVPTAAVTVVTVHPPYRRRGLLTRMMTHELELCAQRREPLAALWASESLIYGRFGFGPAADRAILSGDTRRLQFLPDVRTSGSVDEVAREEFQAVAPRLHEAVRPTRHGAFVRDDDVWEFAIFDRTFARNGATELRYVLHYDDTGEPDGFATYRFKEEFDDDPASEVRIKEVWAEEISAYASIWRYLLDLDLARRFRLWSAPLDEPLRHLVTDARAVRTEVLDGLYLRVVDIEAALTARTYAAEVDLVLEVTDPLLPANTGRYRLRTRGGPGAAAAEVTRTDDAPDVALGILELGTTYLGGVPLVHLQRAGRVIEHTEGSVAAASTAFSWPRAPYAPDMF